jgi:hypothetical protein
MVFSPNNRDFYKKKKKRRGKSEGDRDDRWSIKVRDYVVPNSEEVKFLRLPLHAALKWKQWVAETARRTAEAIGTLSWLRYT